MTLKNGLDTQKEKSHVATVFKSRDVERRRKDTETREYSADHGTE